MRNAAIASELRAEAGTVVAYEADAIDLADYLGWSVIVLGVPRPVTDPDAPVRPVRPRQRAASARAIVLAVDAPSHVSAAVGLTRELCRDSGDSVRVLHVHEFSPTPRRPPADATPGPPTIITPAGTRP
jgi:hypothetical protein